MLLSKGRQCLLGLSNPPQRTEPGSGRQLRLSVTASLRRIICDGDPAFASGNGASCRFGQAAPGTPAYRGR